MKNLIEKLKAVQSQIKVPKTRHNKFGDFKYRNLEDICEALKPLLEANGLVVTMTDETVKLETRYYIKATIILTDGEHHIQTTGYAREPEIKKGMDESQISGMASSYARKYALNGMFCIDDVPDADSMNNKTESAGGSKAAEQKPAVKKEHTPAPTAPPVDFNPPTVDNDKTKNIFEVLSDYYKSQETEKFKFNYDKFLKVVWSKYGRYPTTEQGAKKIKSEITIADCWEEVK